MYDNVAFKTKITASQSTKPTVLVATSREYFRQVIVTQQYSLKWVNTLDPVLESINKNKIFSRQLDLRYIEKVSAKTGF